MLLLLLLLLLLWQSVAYIQLLLAGTWSAH
jgi:hypothetical protein